MALIQPLPGADENDRIVFMYVRLEPSMYVKSHRAVRPRVINVNNVDVADSHQRQGFIKGFLDAMQEAPSPGATALYVQNISNKDFETYLETRPGWFRDEDAEWKLLHGMMWMWPTSA